MKQPQIGIDKITFYVPPTYIEIAELAEARAQDVNKYQVGLGQYKMAVAPLSQDSVTMAVNAALKILNKDDLATIDLVIFASETAIDQSKSAAIYVHKLLNIQPFARCFDIKQACYGATAGLMMAYAHIALNPTSKVLVVAADIARYDLYSSSEYTQGAGAVAMLISQQPRLLALNNDNIFLSDEVMDFWRPNARSTALVNGKLSVRQYGKMFQTLWRTYEQQHIVNQTLAQIAAICFHTPYSSIGRKTLQPMLKHFEPIEAERLLNNCGIAIAYNQQVGNIYTGSLYLNLISLLDHQVFNQEQKIIAYSYGSGAIAEIFSFQLVADYQQYLKPKIHQQMLATRTKISIDEYQSIFTKYSELYTNENIVIDYTTDHSACVLTEIKDNIRIYSLREQ